MHLPFIFSLHARWARFMLGRRGMLRPFVTLFVLGMATTAIAQPDPMAPEPVEGEGAPVEPEPPPESRQPPVEPAPEVEDVATRLGRLEERLARLGHEDRELDRARDAQDLGFRFGSYGRVLAGTDLRGGRPEPVHVVAHGPRIVEQTYLELDFQYLIRLDEDNHVRTVATLAFGDRLFHDTGEFDAQPALRNLFAEMMWGPPDNRTEVWVGSRMYRGDDIYLFDYWPLDDQNTVGGGVARRTSLTEWAAHAGVNRLLDDYQFQERDIADPELGATTITQLDRQRMIGSASVTYFLDMLPRDLTGKIKVHGEVQGLPSGTRLREGDETPEALPADWGTTFGAQLGVWEAKDGQTHRRHVNLFARWSKGLAAFDELAPPFGFDRELKTFPKASEIVFGLGANWDDTWGHVLFGANARRFVDADVNVRDVDDGWEYAVDVRPMLKVRERLMAGVDLAYEARFPRGLMPSTQLAADPGVVSIAPMLVLAPVGTSAYDRPQLRLVYRAARQNEGAQALYAEDDPRRSRTWMHFLGVQAEWWFNSTSYR
jgi:maltoporin